MAHKSEFSSFYTSYCNIYKILCGDRLAQRELCRRQLPLRVTKKVRESDLLHPWFSACVWHDLCSSTIATWFFNLTMWQMYLTNPM